MFTYEQRRDGTLYTLVQGTGQLRYSMLITYRRVGRISVLPALATAAAAVVIAGVAAIALVFVGLAACGVWLLRAFGAAGRADRRASVQDHDTIEGVVVNSTDVSNQLLQLDSDKG